MASNSNAPMPTIINDAYEKISSSNFLSRGTLPLTSSFPN
jgi:hypothetical protein